MYSQMILAVPEENSGKQPDSIFIGKDSKTWTFVFLKMSIFLLVLKLKLSLGEGYNSSDREA